MASSHYFFGDIALGIDALDPQPIDITILDFDGVIAATDINKDIIYVDITVEKFKKAAAANHEILIHTSMEENTVRNELNDEGNSKVPAYLPTRENAKKLFEDILKETNSNTKVIFNTPMDVLTQKPVGHSFEEDYLPLYTLYKQNRNQDRAVDRNKLSKEQRYQQIKLKELYFCRFIASIFSIMLSEKIPGYEYTFDRADTKSFLISISEVLSFFKNNNNNNNNQEIENTLQLAMKICDNGMNLEDAFLDEFKADINSHYNNPYLTCAVELLQLMIQSTNIEILKQKFSQYLSRNQQYDFVQANQKVFELIKDIKLDFKPEKFLMSIYWLQTRLATAEDGATFNIEYIDDVEHNLQAMLEAIKEIMKTHEKRIMINIHTTHATGQHDGNFRHEPHSHLCISSLSDNSEVFILLEHLQSLKEFYLKIETGTKKRLDEFDGLIKDMNETLKLPNPRKKIANIFNTAFAKHRNHTHAFLKYTPLTDDEYFHRLTDKNRVGNHHYSRLLVLLLKQLHKNGIQINDHICAFVNRFGNDYYNGEDPKLNLYFATPKLSISSRFERKL